MKLKLLSLSLLLFALQWAAAQNVRVSGTVTFAEGGETAIGVNVLEAGTTNGTTTEVDGTYSLEVQKGATVQFTYTGMEAQEFVVNQAMTLDVKMAENSRLLQEVVVTDYISVKKADLTGAVGIVNMEDAKQESQSNVLNALQGRVAGVSITQDGTPGGGNTFINIRGLSTINNNDPLFVIDGVPTTKFNLNSLNPNDIESLQVLKDAASATIYGSRASNGVILITTKKGKKGKTGVVFDSYAGYQQLQSSLRVLNAYEWGQVYWQAKRNAGDVAKHPQYGSYTDPIMPSFIDGDGVIPAANTDWVHEAFNPALIQQYSIGFSNATDAGDLYFSASYMNQEGIMRYTGFNKYTVRMNSSYKIYNRLRIGENLNVSFRSAQGLDDRGFMHTILYQHPLVPVHDLNGGWGGPTDGLGDKPNPIRVLYDQRATKRDNWQVFGNVFGELEIMKGLTARTSFGIDYINAFYKKFDPTWSEGTRSVTENYLYQDYKHDLIWNWTNTLNYQRTFGKHDLNAVAGIEAIKAFGTGFWGRQSSFLVQDPDFRYLDAGTGEAQTGGWGVGSSLYSYFGKVNYVFNSRYLLSGTLRHDGSSRLGANNRTDVFPALSVGWRLSEEGFMKDIPAISSLKLRAGWGKTGNQEIDPSAAYTFFRSNVETGQYNIPGDNSTPEPGYILSRNGNPNLRWETSTQTNFGIDLNLWNNRLEFTADYFTKNTDGMLVDPPLLSTQGEGAPPVINAGKMENKGLELLLNYRSPARSKFRYNVGVNFSKIENKVTELGEGNDFFLLAEGSRIQPGYPVMSFYGYVADGLFKSIEEVQNHAFQPGIEANERSLGRIRYKDLNNDGVIDALDRKFIGNPHPDFTYGITLGADFMGFDFTAFFEGVQGREIFNTHKRINDFTYWQFNYGASTLDAWSPENPDSDIPAVSTSNINDEYRSSTYFIEDGSFLKLKSLTFGYTLPKTLTRKAEIRFYLQGQNVFILENYSGNDVEVQNDNAKFMGIDWQTYPHSRNLVFGVNATF